MPEYRLTPEDRLLIDAHERSRGWSFDTEESIVRRISDGVSQAESAMRWHPQRVLDFYLQGFEAITDGNFRVKDPAVRFGAPLVDNWLVVQEGVTRRLGADEAEDDDETPSSVHTEREMVRRWAGISPYVAYRFFQYVMDAATEVLREDLCSMSADYDRGEGVACAAREASTKWIRAWEKGSVL